MEAGDSRQGLDDAGKKEVMRIMKRRGVDFDEAAARRHPVPEPLAHDRWALLRNIDGSVQRP